MRVALGIAYEGSGYHGWQRQQVGIKSVQGDLEAALSIIADQTVSVTCAGRTDTGVHALGQVVHFDTDQERPDKAWVQGGNAHLPDTISINWAQQVPAHFDARRTATSRRYCYFIHNSRVRHALLHNLITREHRLLDANRMHEAAQSLIGEQDFSSFRSSQCQSLTPMRNVQSVTVSRQGSLVIIDIRANAFLHHMVRNIAGVLMDIGAGARDTDWIRDLLALRDRNKGSVTAPPDGLFLVDVSYPGFSFPDDKSTWPHFFSALIPS